MSVERAEVAEGLSSDPSSIAREENRRLRRTMRDLVALSTLPAVWSGLGGKDIASSLSEVLLNTLSLDLVYVRLRERSRTGLVEVLRSRPSQDPRRAAAAKASLATLLDDSRDDPPQTIADPFGLGTLRVAVIRFGVGADHGALVACSRSADFPTERDRLLLGVGANQTAIVVQRRQAEDQVDEQREWLRVTLASIGDAVIATDIEGRVTFLNNVAEGLTGWTRDEAEGKPLEAVFRLVDESTRRPAESRVDKVRREGAVVGMATSAVLIARDDSERPVDDSAAPIRNSAGDIIGVVMVFRDATEQRRAEQHRNARLAITQALNQSSTVQEAAASVLQAVCESLAWDAGFFWFANDRTDRLECGAYWHRPGLPLAAFVSESCSRGFASGEGLPGRVWSTQQPVWISELAQDDNFPRHAVAAQDGLRCAFACPVVIGERTLGVVEFFMQRSREPDPDLLEMMATAAGSIGQFIERKSAEDELRRSEAELAEFFENATVGLHWVGPDGKVLRVNRAELEMLGYSKEEYVGHPVADFHADDDVICDILAKLNAGVRLTEYPARLRCKDGTVKHVLIDSSVLWKDGRFIHTRCFTRDITERTLAEAALADARARLEAALEAGAIATWTWDIPHNLLFADSKLSQLFNLPPTDGNGAVLGRYLQSVHPDDVPRIMAALDRAIATGEPYEADYRILQEDGSVRWVTARGRAECDAAGRAVRMPGVLVDITERKLLEEALRDADRRKDEFLATLAHELRNPLAPIRNSLEILKRPGVDAVSQQQSKAMMERQVHHLVRLVDDLMDVSRVMRGRIELRKEPVELASVIARAIETVQPLIETHRHCLELSLPHESLLVDADGVRLTQVLSNLLTNSAKYTEPNGHIRLSAAREGGLVALRVRDDGIGISAEMLPHIFELFVQVDHTSTKAQGGLGIGLTLAKNLVQMHGGSIEAHSAGLRRGSEFVVRLPLMVQQLPDAGADTLEGQAVPEEAATCSGHRLLVVDDNGDAALSLAMLLRLQGHDVRVAHDGPSALALATAYHPHMVFLDIGMPGMDGYEVARRLRQQPGLEGIVLAALTGWGQQQDRRRTAEAGFDHHLVKPPEAEALESLLKAL
ncbi:PAS domain S-box protein [Caldimonas brevitalea]|uniref:histidine kinase n=1 Tax=Caldimonas brevitalea TaxID=413882 RepID=A0A0G3BKT4_9BURK|nr:PAS domain S-box protein [Caldimonas brevitalea]AKJ27150.1 chemotaxis protein methyltransferase CheR [Caldimonas brevitalea]